MPKADFDAREVAEICRLHSAGSPDSTRVERQQEGKHQRTHA